MARHPILCIWPNGSTFSVTAAEAGEIIHDGLGEWRGRKTIRMACHGRSGGRLSLRVGAALSEAVRRNEAWAGTMVEQIER